MVSIQMEDLGFCKKGEVGAFLDANTMTFDGSFPLNTGGGLLSCGQAGGAGGMIALTEAVRQLRNLKNPEVDQLLQKVWGAFHEVSANKKAEIAKYTAVSEGVWRCNA